MFFRTSSTLHFEQVQSSRRPSPFRKFIARPGSSYYIQEVHTPFEPVRMNVVRTSLVWRRYQMKPYSHCSVMLMHSKCDTQLKIAGLVGTVLTRFSAWVTESKLILNKVEIEYVIYETKIRSVRAPPIELNIGDTLLKGNHSYKDLGTTLECLQTNNQIKPVTSTETFFKLSDNCTQTLTMNTTNNSIHHFTHSNQSTPQPPCTHYLFIKIQTVLY